MSELSSRHGRFLCVSESTYGDDAVDAALSDGTIDLIYQDIRSGSLDPTRVQVDSPRIRSTHSGTRHKTIGDHVPVTLEFPLQPLVAASAGDEAPYCSPIYKAANLEETIVSATSSAYNPSTKQQAGMTVYHYEEELESARQRLTYTTGVRGTLSFDFQLDQEAMCTFTGTGLYQGPISNDFEYFNSAGGVAKKKTGINSVTARSTGEEKYADQSPYICENMTITIDGTSYALSGINVDLNWSTIQKRQINSQNVTSKVLCVRDEGNRIGGSMSLVDGTQGIEGLISSMAVDDSEATLIITISNGSRTTTFNFPQIQLGQPTKGDNGGLRTYDIPWFANGDFSDLAGDNDFTMTNT